MDYEELYQRLQPLEKKAGDKMTAALKSFRGLRKDSGAGDLKSFAKNLQALEENVREQAALLAELKEQTEAFDAKSYMEGGGFARQLEFELKQLDVDVKGDFPSYEVFPYKVRADAENTDVYIDRKKIQCVRPSALAQLIKAGRDKLFKVSFNAAAFVNELCTAYDFAIAVKNKNKPGAPEDADIYLKDLYDFLLPMHRFRRDYDMQAYAFDLSRLCASKAADTKDGRRLDFGTSRKPAKMIRILDEQGNEQFLTTVRFFTPSAELFELESTGSVAN